MREEIAFDRRTLGLFEDVLGIWMTPEELLGRFNQGDQNAIQIRAELEERRSESSSRRKASLLQLDRQNGSLAKILVQLSEDFRCVARSIVRRSAPRPRLQQPCSALDEREDIHLAKEKENLSGTKCRRTD